MQPVMHLAPRATHSRRCQTLILADGQGTTDVARLAQPHARRLRWTLLGSDAEQQNRAVHAAYFEIYYTNANTTASYRRNRA